jgi:2-dehydro-3-deoxy-D-arabinonate dehydratase
MNIFKKQEDVLVLKDGSFYLFKNTDWTTFVNKKGLHAAVAGLIKSESYDEKLTDIDRSLCGAPIQDQEVWAAGVTYLRSKQARMEESKDSGGATFYDKVYDADRPELFFKAMAQRVSGPGEEVYIRRDSKWNVPEPELTLFFSSEGTIEGYTVGNDMSSRDIEGENPLYLPQAKVYEKCAGLGPSLYVSPEPIDPQTEISLSIERQEKVVFQGSIRIDQMKRGHEELGGFLFRECDFPNGVYLMTGTCLVPDDDFTLAVNDIIRVHITHIGTLENLVNVKG